MMHAMILAAGRGLRMRPLTDEVPKPLLTVAGKPLLQHHIEALAQSGVRNIVINHGPRGHLIEAAFGSGAQFGVQIRYSPEGEQPLETGGGIKQALTLLGSDPYILVNADIYTDFDFATLPQEPRGLAHLVLVENPAHHPEGDFSLEGGLVREPSARALTYAGIGVYRHALVRDVAERVFPLAPLIRKGAAAGLISGQHYTGHWVDVGTPERLLALNQRPLRSPGTGK